MSHKQKSMTFIGVHSVPTWLKKIELMLREMDVSKELIIHIDRGDRKKYLKKVLEFQSNLIKELERKIETGTKCHRESFLAEMNARIKAEKCLEKATNTINSQHQVIKDLQSRLQIQVED